MPLNFPSLNELLKYHDDERRINYLKSNYHRVKEDVIIVSKYFENGTKILNVGSDPFILEDILKSFANLFVDSVDCSSQWAEKYSKLRNHNLIVCDIENVNARNKLDFPKYNIIVMTEIFEHLRIDLISQFEDIYKQSSKGTLLYITTPNFLTIEKIIYFLSKFRSGPVPLNQWLKLHKFGHMGHVREYTMSEVDEIIQFCGFKKIDYGYRNLSKQKSKRLTKKFIYFLSNILVKFIPQLSEDFYCLYKKV